MFFFLLGAVFIANGEQVQRHPQQQRQRQLKQSWQQRHASTDGGGWVLAGAGSHELIGGGSTQNNINHIACGGGAQPSEGENCDAGDLYKCVHLIPQNQVGLPRNKQELDTHCSVYHTGMVCMDAWMRRCVPTDGQKLIQQQIGGARALMRFLCTNETALRREFLKEPTCWGRVSPDWTSCVYELQDTVRDVTDRSPQPTYFNRNFELCCARDTFMICVTHIGRACSSAASNLLKRMAWVLAQDVACSQPISRCSAPPPPFTAPLLTALCGVVLYPPRL